ncbi:queuosine 5'-phosphate N-glycosylase/hydrolase-like [Watersipora subatra]|uniref:queuosine 5'-phosphate N-glycosylase/hydrolase-like n=1 Tax=Watersipora subatra TaxID=2589382 RepID=UPI00355C2E5E
MPDALGPRESAQIISNNSRYVTISPDAINVMSGDLLEEIRRNPEYIHFKGWKAHALNPKTCDDRAVNWIFLVDALNFSFWSSDSDKKYCVSYKGKTYTGYWSMCAAINRAIDEGIPITSALYCKELSLKEARRVFRSDSETDLPMLEQRVKVMNDIGTVLLSKYDGKFTNCILQAVGNAQMLLASVVKSFPCFKDEGVFNGKNVSFYKRAQILVADIWACFEGNGLGNFSDIDSITMFADYRIPQTLVYFGVMRYENELLELLEADHLFENGDLMEMEIRGVSVWAVELLVKRMKELLKENSIEIKINAILLDHFLWDYRREHEAETKHIPFHKVRCIYY